MIEAPNKVARGGRTGGDSIQNVPSVPETRPEDVCAMDRRGLVGPILHGRVPGTRWVAQEKRRKAGIPCDKTAFLWTDNSWGAGPEK